MTLSTADAASCRGLAAQERVPRPRGGRASSHPAPVALAQGRRTTVSPDGAKGPRGTGTPRSQLLLWATGTMPGSLFRWQLVNFDLAGPP